VSPIVVTVAFCNDLASAIITRSLRLSVTLPAAPGFMNVVRSTGRVLQPMLDDLSSEPRWFSGAAGQHIKEYTIYREAKAVVAPSVTDEDTSEIEHQSDIWDDERQQMLDDYD
jgi:hypothetical protein